MPEYNYHDKNGHYETITHRMGYTTGIICWSCGEDMQRLPPERVSVAWGGLAPSKGTIHPKIKKFIDDAPKRREKFYEEHKEHERRTEHV